MRTSADFERVRAEGRRVSGPRVTVWVAPRADPSMPSRLGLAVGGGVGPAVVRNRVRRRLREAWRSSSPPPGLDFVAAARPGAGLGEFQELSDLFARAAGGQR